MIVRPRAAAIVVVLTALGGCGSLLGLSDVGYGVADGGGADAPAEGGEIAESGTDGGRGDTGPAEAGCATPPDLSADCDAGYLRCVPGGECIYSAATDTNHCGVCERACDQTCIKGNCAPLALATGASAGGARAVALDDAWAYWIADGQQAFREAVDAGGASDPLTGAYGGLWDLVVDADGRFYHVSSSGFERSGIGQQTEHLHDMAGSGGARLVLDDARAYWTEGAGGGGNVASALKDGGGYVSLASGKTDPGDLFVAGPGRVIFARGGAGTIEVADITTPGSPATRIQGLAQLRAMVGRDGWGYFLVADPAGGFALWRFDTTTFTRSMLAGGLVDAEHLAVDDTFVYVSRRLGTAFAIYRVPKCGGVPALVTASLINAPSSIVVSSRRVAWVESNQLVQTSK